MRVHPLCPRVSAPPGSGAEAWHGRGLLRGEVSGRLPGSASPLLGVLRLVVGAFGPQRGVPAGVPAGCSCGAGWAGGVRAGAAPDVNVVAWSGCCPVADAVAVAEPLPGGGVPPPCGRVCACPPPPRPRCERSCGVGCCPVVVVVVKPLPREVFRSCAGGVCLPARPRPRLPMPRCARCPPGGVGQVVVAVTVEWKMVRFSWWPVMVTWPGVVRVASIQQGASSSA